MEIEGRNERFEEPLLLNTASMFDSIALSDSGDDTSDIIADVRNLITDYCKEHNVLLRKTRNDAYFILCNYESLEEMEADKFSLLEEVRKLGQKEIIPPTISVGIAYDFPGVTKLNEMAGNAIEIAMSRGGDQVVVSQYGEELQFLGGKTVATENRNKVKVRVMGDSVLSLIKSSSNVIVMGHTMMDMDALGACLGIKAMCDYLQKEALIVYEPKFTERKAKSVITNYLDKFNNSYFVNEAKALGEIRSNTLVVVLDVHKPKMTMSPKILEKATKVMVIDHHRRGEEFIDSPIFATIDPSASSTSEIVAELLYYASSNPRITVPESYATVMLSGIFLDSNFFKNTTSGSKTFEASMILKEYGADNAMADDFLKDEFEEYALINKIISTLKTPHYGVVYCTSEEGDIIESATLAKVANKCMEMKGVEACFVIGRTGMDEVKKFAEVEDAVIAHRPGETITEQMRGLLAQITVRILGSVESKEQLLPTMNKIEKTLHILSTDGRELMLPGIEKEDIEGFVN